MSIARVVAWAMIMAWIGQANGATRYVDLNNTTPAAPYASWADAATNIQDAIDQASAGDLVLVTNGVYNTGGRAVYGALTNRVVVDKAITLQSVNGPAVTSIEGNPSIGPEAIRCVYLTNDATISGFTVRSGATTTDETAGGIWCESTSAVVTNCVIAQNQSATGTAGVFQGTVSRCLLFENTDNGESSESSGGAAGYCVLNNCIISNNVASVNGGGIASSVANACVFSGNSVGWYGGAAFGSTLNNCVLTNNSALWGGGAYQSTLNNCTVVLNSGTEEAGGLFDCTANNCIVYFNTAPGNQPNYFGGELNSCCSFPLSYPSTQVSRSFTNDPMFVNLAAGDLRLAAGSFCINAGNNSFLTNAVDLDGNPRLVGSFVDVGAYEFQTPAPVPLAVHIDADFTFFIVGYSDPFHATIAGNESLSIWNFGDGVTVTNQLDVSHQWSAPGTYFVVFTAFNDNYPAGVTATQTVQVVTNAFAYVSLNSTTPVAPYDSWNTAATEIQQAIDAIAVGGTVIVSNGIYQTGAYRPYGGVSNRVAITKAISVESLNGPAVTIIKGYQVPGITNGPTSIRCVWLTNGARLSGFTLTNGSTYFDPGAGAYCFSATAVVSNCVIVGNVAKSIGGGCFGGIVQNCIVRSNISFQTGGGGFGGRWTNCLVLGNYTTGNGGGLNSSTIQSCTIVSNYSVGPGGGTSSGTAQNSIIYYNASGANSLFTTNVASTTVSYSCTFPKPSGSGPDMITNAPVFVDRTNGNFRLQLGSRCMNAGTNSSATLTDLDGNPRLVGGTEDMGAYENQYGGIIHYVNVKSATPQLPYTNWTTAATNIQDAVAVAQPGEVVVVESGVYTNGGAVVFGSETNRVALTNAISLLSLNGPQTTVIAGQTSTRCVYLGSNSLLSGFTLQGGRTSFSGDTNKEKSGAGLWCEPGALATNCVIVSNTAMYHGAGVFGGILKNCVISSNYATVAGGGAFRAALYSCSVISNSANSFGGGGGGFQCLMSNCVIAGNLSTDFSTAGHGGGTYGGTNYFCLISNNVARINGGGTYQSTNYNCTIVNNRSAMGSGGGSVGGASFSCLLSSNTCSSQGGGSYQGLLYNCILRDNISTNQGGGNWGGQLYNCTVVGNASLTGSGGGGLYSATAYNSIIYSNSVTSGSGSNLAGASPIFFCCSEPFLGTGCFTNAPKFINYAGRDLHLAANSPCINSGNNLYVTNAGVWFDFENHPRLVSTFVDVGAYEVQSPGSILPYTWLAKYGLKTDGSDDFADTDGDGMNNWQEWKAQLTPTDSNSVLRLVSVTSTPPTSATITWTSVFGVRYFVERSLNLGSAPFVSLQEDIQAVSGTTTFTDPSATNATSFYRVGIR